MTPLGIVVGASIGAALTGRADALFQAIFDSLGAGTFIYIAALDIIKTEFDNPRYRGEVAGRRPGLRHHGRPGHLDLTAAMCLASTCFARAPTVQQPIALGLSKEQRGDP